MTYANAVTTIFTEKENLVSAILRRNLVLLPYQQGETGSNVSEIQNEIIMYGVFLPKELQFKTIFIYFYFK